MNRVSMALVSGDGCGLINVRGKTSQESASGGR